MKIVKTFQRFLKPVKVICLGWIAFFSGILIDDSTVAILFEAVARVLP